MLARPELVQHGFREAPRGWLAWVMTTDHKRIGVMYLVATFGFFVLGGTEALLLRLQLGTRNNTLIDPGTYNAIMTMHGTTMVFLFVVPVWAGFANYMVPLRAGNDPWQANTLEWFVPSPPPAHNFDVIPQVRSVAPLQDIRSDLRDR